MISEERKQELVGKLEYYVERHLDKQDIIGYIISDLVEDDEEKDYLWGCNKYYTVDAN